MTGADWPGSTFLLGCSDVCFLLPRMSSSSSLLNPPAVGKGKFSKAGRITVRKASRGSTPG